MIKKIPFSRLVRECMSIYNHKSKAYKGADAKKILREYFNIVGKTILTGQEYKFPKTFGTMYVCKHKARQSDNVTAYSPVIGIDYDIVLKSPYLDRFDYEYKASETIRSNLNKQIRKGKDYIHYGN